MRTAGAVELIVRVSNADGERIEIGRSRNPTRNEDINVMASSLCPRDKRTITEQRSNGNDKVISFLRYTNLIGCQNSI